MQNGSKEYLVKSGFRYNGFNGPVCEQRPAIIEYSFK